jgi:hypothetical protein
LIINSFYIRDQCPEEQDDEISFKLTESGFTKGRCFTTAFQAELASFDATFSRFMHLFADIVKSKIVLILLPETKCYFSETTPFEIAHYVKNFSKNEKNEIPAICRKRVPDFCCTGTIH